MRLWSLEENELKVKARFTGDDQQPHLLRKGFGYIHVEFDFLVVHLYVVKARGWAKRSDGFRLN